MKAWVHCVNHLSLSPITAMGHVNVHWTVFVDNYHFLVGMRHNTEPRGFSTALGQGINLFPTLAHRAGLCPCGCLLLHERQRTPPHRLHSSVRSRSRSFLHSRLRVREKGLGSLP